VVRVGDLTIDPVTRAARLGGEPLHLSHGRRGPPGRRVAHDQQRLSLRRRAGAPLRREPRPADDRPPGTSLHRNGTELDLGPPSAYGWLARRADDFGFVKCYSWEPWHYGYTHNVASRPAIPKGGRGGDESSLGGINVNAAPRLWGDHHVRSS